VWIKCQMHDPANDGCQPTHRVSCVPSRGRSTFTLGIMLRLGLFREFKGHGAAVLTQFVSPFASVSPANAGLVVSLARRRGFPRIRQPFAELRKNSVVSAMQGAGLYSTSAQLAVRRFAEPLFPGPTVSVYEERMHSWVQMPKDIGHRE
jgi:hypothetical protein